MARTAVGHGFIAGDDSLLTATSGCPSSKPPPAGLENGDA